MTIANEIGLFEAMYTARSQRHFKPDPVPDALVEKVIDAAIRASSGGNTQHWTFIVVRDPAKRREIGALYRKASDYAETIYRDRPTPPHLTNAQNRQFVANSAFLWDHMGDAPVILVPCLARREPPPIETLPSVVQARYAQHLANMARTSGASIYPAVQNIILACRALGLGTVITTNHMLYEDEVKATLGIPESVSTFALMPIGFPTRKYGPLTRKPVAEVTYVDGWGKPWTSEKAGS
ncbi:MAG: nitroreductase family protein [Reyranellaceae bacterium]